MTVPTPKPTPHCGSQRMTFPSTQSRTPSTWASLSYPLQLVAHQVLLVWLPNGLSPSSPLLAPRPSTCSKPPPSLARLLQEKTAPNCSSTSTTQATPPCVQRLFNRVLLSSYLVLARPSSLNMVITSFGHIPLTPSLVQAPPP